MARRDPSPLDQPEAIPSVWAQAVRTLRGDPLVFYSKADPFKNRPFLPSILNDLASVVVMQKCRQVGATELGACSQALWFCSTLPSTSVIYTLPREDQVSEVSTIRVDSAIQDSRYLSSRCVSKKESRKVFRPSRASQASLQSYLMFKSSWESALGEGTPADVLYYDEYDRMKEGVEEAFRESISSSRLGLQRFLSTPTLPDRGVAGLYERSDKRSWLWKCQSCDEWQKLDWDVNVRQTQGQKDILEQIRFRTDLEIVPGTFVIECAHCHKPLNRMVAEGQWVAEHPSREIHGYHISQLDAPWLSADAIASKLATTRFIAMWKAYSLGLPWAGDGQPILESDILACVNSQLDPAPPGRPSDSGWVSLGCDWGEVNWAVLLDFPSVSMRGSRPRLRDIAWWSSKGETAHAAVRGVDQNAVKFGANIIIADAGYGQDRNPICRDRHRDKFWACRYSTAKLATYEPVWNPTLSIREVQVGRTAALKLMIEMVRYGMIEIAPLPPDKMRVLISHLTSLAQVKEEDPKTGEVFEQIVRTGPDHLAHALTYALIGALRGKSSIATLTMSSPDEPKAKLEPPPSAADLPKPRLILPTGSVLLPPGAKGNGFGGLF